MDTTGSEPATGTLEGALAHARAQAGRSAATGLTIPASAATDLPDGVAAEAVRWDETVPVGGYATRRLPRGAILRVSDLTGGACVNLQLVNARDTFEKLNPADTVKVQWQAYLGEGAVLLSGQGRALATVVADTSGRHDALCGNGRRQPRSTRQLLLLGAARHGLGRRDVNAGINLFTGVRVADDGSLHLDAPTGPAHVDLRLELDLVVIVANNPHPLDDRTSAPDATVRLTAWQAPPADAATDPWRATTPERERAFLNTDDYRLGAVG